MVGWIDGRGQGEKWGQDGGGVYEGEAGVTNSGTHILIQADPQRKE
jgi:hypothetical protein